jgi:hypothetical protein
MEVPVQYFQSIIAVELAVTGALLFQIRYFEPRQVAEAADGDLPDPRLRLLVAVVLAATVFGSLDALLHRGGSTAAVAVTVGLAVSLLPILVRVLPPLFREARPGEGRRYSTITIVGLVLYAVAVAALVFLLNR